MYLQSKLPENLKKQTVEKTIATTDDSMSIESLQIYARGEGLQESDVKIRPDSIETNHGEWENGLVVYFKREETDQEHQKRIQDLELKDISEFARILGSYNTACLDKDFLKELFTKHCTGGDGRRLTDWQEKLVRQFFGEKSVAELVEEAYNRGRTDGEKEYQKLKQTMQNTLSGK